MTFYVEKKLALGSISFGVSTRREAESIDGDPALNTGPSGEFVRRRGEGFFFGGRDRFSTPVVPTTPTISSMPFWSSLKPDGTLRSYGFLALLGFGALLVLLGFAVIARKGPQGWAEVILGGIMIAIPITLTAQTRKKIREQEERERAEREATEKRNRELLAAYTAALERARDQRDEDAFSQLERERASLTLPYEIWGAAARRTILLIGFDELARRGPAEAREVIDRASRAAGLTPEDQAAVKIDVYRTIVWHLLADDRLGEAQEQRLRSIRQGLGISENVPAIEEFRRLRGLSLPRQNCSVPLGFQEYCIYQTQSDQGTLHVTNKRFMVEGKKRLEMPIAHVELNVNADDNVVTIKTEKKPLRLRVDEPIYTAAILDLSSQIDERPRGFA
jgi:hypothetical protein